MTEFIETEFRYRVYPVIETMDQLLVAETLYLELMRHFHNIPKFIANSELISARLFRTVAGENLVSLKK